MSRSIVAAVAEHLSPGELRKFEKELQGASASVRRSILAEWEARISRPIVQVEVPPLAVAEMMDPPAPVVETLAPVIPIKSKRRRKCSPAACPFPDDLCSGCKFFEVCQ